MVLRKDAKVLVLLPVEPKCPLLQSDSFWSTIDSSVMANHQSIIQFKKIECHCVAASIETNPKLETVQSGVSHFDLMDGLGSQNSGCLIHFGEDDDCDAICKLVTWNMVLQGRLHGIQTWSERSDFRNLSTAFNNRKKTNIGLVSLLNAMHFEMCGDRMQCVHLLSCFLSHTVKAEAIRSQIYVK